MYKTVVKSVIAIIAVTTIFHLANAQAALADGQGKYASTGIPDSASFDRFYTELREAVLKEDKRKVASLWKFPMVFDLPNKKRMVLGNGDDMVKNYDQIFNKDVKAAFERTELSKINYNWQGFEIGDGEMWIVPTNRVGQFYIGYMSVPTKH
jgi:hypothetical protein